MSYQFTNKCCFRVTYTRTPSPANQPKFQQQTNAQTDHLLPLAMSSSIFNWFLAINLLFTIKYIQVRFILPERFMFMRCKSLRSPLAADCASLLWWITSPAWLMSAPLSPKIGSICKNNRWRGIACWRLRFALKWSCECAHQVMNTKYKF